MIDYLSWLTVNWFNIPFHAAFAPIAHVIGDWLCMQWSGLAEICPADWDRRLSLATYDEQAHSEIVMADLTIDVDRKRVHYLSYHL